MDNNRQAGYLQGALGTRLFYQRWRAPQPKATLLIVHGLGEHSSRYSFPVEYFVPLGFTIYGFDHRGHGQSDGPRAYAPNLRVFLEDIRHVLALVQKEEKDRPVFIVAHSFGGQLAANYGLSYPNGQKGIIFSSPNIGLAMPVPPLKAFLGRRLASLFPQFLVTNEIDPAWVSRDPEVVEAYREDPMVCKQISLKLADLILENQNNLIGWAPQFKAPALFMHGGADKVCSPEATRTFYKHAGSTDKALKVYKGYFHEIFNDIGREVVFKDMETWIRERL